MNQSRGLGLVFFFFFSFFLMKGYCFLSLQESLYVPFRERKKVSLKSEDTSNAEQRKEANGPTGRTQDTTEYVLSNALAWGCRQIACGHNKCVAAEKFGRCRGKRQVVSSPFPTFRCDSLLLVRF